MLIKTIWSTVHRQWRHNATNIALYVHVEDRAAQEQILRQYSVPIAEWISFDMVIIET